MAGEITTTDTTRAEGDALSRVAGTDPGVETTLGEGSLLGSEKSSAADGEGAKDGDKAPEPAPLELKLPEGISEDDPVLADFRPLAQELGLKSDGAQKLLDLYAKATAPLNAAAKEYEAEQRSWIEAVKSDPEIGGAKLNESLAVARAGVTRFGGPELAKVLDATGIGNNPVVVRAFVAIGKAIAEDSIAGASRSATDPAQTEQERLRAMYPNSPGMFNEQA